MRADASLQTFETALGVAGIAWAESGVLALAFPETDRPRVLRQLKRRAPHAVEAPPPAKIAALIESVQALLRGSSVRFDDAELDMGAVADFDREVLNLTRKIGPGETRTYGDLAKALGDVLLSRRVGQALGRNPFPIVVPCHRVVGADSRMTGFSAPGGAAVKEKLLKIEGALAPGLFD